MRNSRKIQINERFDRAVKPGGISYLRHGIVIGLFLRVSPIDNNITAPNLNTAGFQSALGKTSRFVGFVFQEAKSTVKEGENQSKSTD